MKIPNIRKFFGKESKPEPKPCSKKPPNAGAHIRAILAVTYRCQAKCAHCGSAKLYRKDKKEMSTEQLKDVIRQLAEIGVESVSFFGGEPLLRKDLLELVKYVSDLGMGAILETNALALDKEMVTSLKEAGLNTATISIDSANPEKHDRLRGIPGLFDKMIKAVKHCKDAGLTVHLSAYADRTKLEDDDFLNIIALAKKMGVQVRTLAPVLAGKWMDAEDLQLTQEEVQRFKSMLEPGVAFWEQENCCGEDSEFRCIARDKEFVYISCYGDVTPCCYVPASFGNILEEPLETILNRMWKDRVFTYPYKAGCLMNEKDFRDDFIDQMRDAPRLPIQVPEREAAEEEKGCSHTNGLCSKEDT